MSDSYYPFRLLAAEVLAYSVCKLFPQAQLVSSEITAVGFYCDFFVEQPLDEQAIPLLETAIKTLIKEGRAIKIQEMMRENGADLLRHHGQPLAAAILEDDPHNIVPIIEIDRFYASFPMGKKISFPKSTKEIGPIKILAITSAIASVPEWEELPTVRIHAAAFPNPQLLKQFLKKWAKFQKQGYPLLIKEMKIATPLEEGFCWLPTGYKLRELFEGGWREQVRQQGFQIVKTPGWIRNEKEPQNRAFAHAQLLTLGHFGECDFPVRFAEMTDQFVPLPRQKLEGMLHTQFFSADALHQFCKEEQVLNELISSLQFFDKSVKIIGFEYQWHLIASRGIHSAGTLARWDLAANWLSKAIQTCGFEYEREPLEEAALGPRLEMRISDSLGRQWPGPALTVDLHHPKTCKLHDKKGGQKSPLAMLSGSLFGSIERFIALLLDHFAGQLPLYLAPEQVRVIPVGEQKAEYANSLRMQIENAGFRTSVDQREDKLSGKVHTAEQERIPYLVIAGDKEEKEGLITLRSCRKGGLQSRMPLEQFLEQLGQEQEFKEGVRKG